MNHEMLQKLLINHALSDKELEKLAEGLLASKEIKSDDPYILCRSAFVLFHYSMRKKKRKPLLLALDKLMQAKASDPKIFENSSKWHQLWGNILVELARLMNDSSFIEKALNHYEEASKISDKTAELYWDWAEAWVLLFKHSSERFDLKNALEKFNIAAKSLSNLPLFLSDYAITYMYYGMLVGDPFYLEEAIKLFGVPDRAWFIYTQLLKQRFKITHSQKHFDEADVAYREAILASPEMPDLWLEWGELYLYLGWLKYDLKAVDTGFDKLTSLKVKECDPFRLSSLLGKGLTLLGQYLDDLKLLKQGRMRILTALELAPSNVFLLTSMGYCEFAFASYFADSKYYEKAAAYFEKGIENDALTVETRHGLFRSHLNGSILDKNPKLARKALEEISFLCSLRSFSPLYFKEWGLALVQLYELEQDLSLKQAALEEAVLKFERAYTLSQDDDDVVYHWGCALDQLGKLTQDEKDYEKAIVLLSQAYEKKPFDKQICTHLALTFSHLGELIADCDPLIRAIELFELLTDDKEDADLWGNFGYTLLYLSDLIYDEANPEEGKKLRKSAEEKLLHAVEEGNREANYHLACLYSLCNLIELSMHYLRRANDANVLPSKADLEQNRWLANICKSGPFKEFMMRY